MYTAHHLGCQEWKSWLKFWISIASTIIQPGSWGATLMPAKFLILILLTTAFLIVCPMVSYAQSCTVDNQVACEKMLSSSPCMHYMCAPGPAVDKMKKPTAGGAAAAHGDGAQHEGPPVGQLYHCVEVQRDVGDTCFDAGACIPRGTCDANGICSGPQIQCNATSSATADGVRCSCLGLQCIAVCNENSSCPNVYKTNPSILDPTKACSVAPGSPPPFVPAQ